MTRLAALVLVVRNLERALVVYEQGLGFERVEEPAEVPGLGARHAVLRGQNCVVELLEPNDDEKPPGLFLRARGEGIFSLALELDEPVAARERLRAAGIEPRGPADHLGRWFLRPGDAHGLLVQVASAE
jgi:hypothetical protein